MKNKILVALDVETRAEALTLADTLRGSVGGFKIGSRLFTAEGPSMVRALTERGDRVFLDLKFHDIPNTVKHAVIEAAKLGASMLTVHSSGGRAMMQSVSETLAKDFGSSRPLVVAVTVLTSFDQNELTGIGIDRTVAEHVHHLAQLAQDCGMDGIVCSPLELASVRKVVRPTFKIVTPGIRLPGQSLNDQQRIATPTAAISAGADYIVIGRAVTASPDPRAVLASLSTVDSAVPR